MRTTIEVDEKLLRDVIHVTGERRKSRAIGKALEEYLRNDRLIRLLGRQGRLDLDLDDWDEFRHLDR